MEGVLQVPTTLTSRWFFLRIFQCAIAGFQCFEKPNWSIKQISHRASYWHTYHHDITATMQELLRTRVGFYPCAIMRRCMPANVSFWVPQTWSCWPGFLYAMFSRMGCTVYGIPHAACKLREFARQRCTILGAKLYITTDPLFLRLTLREPSIKGEINIHEPRCRFD